MMPLSADSTSYPNPTRSPILRILCLHGSGSNAAELKQRLDLLGTRLYDKHSIDLVYVNAPLTKSGVAFESSYDEIEMQAPNEEQPRFWWDEKDHSRSLKEDSSNAVATDDRQRKPHYLGLDASLMLVRQMWASCPFWGIIGFGQGAAIASILLALLESDQLRHGFEPNRKTIRSSVPPQFAIFASGESIVHTEEPLLVDGSNIELLHLVDANVSEQQEQLIRQFGGKVEQSRSRQRASRDRAGNTQDLNLMGRFIVAQKKRVTQNAPVSLSRSSSSRDIITLQSELYLAEQQAANCVADTVALNPPAALMAIIRPQAVGGWNGYKRREPDEEGGGAPCPAEFLLQTQDRQGASRAHPNQRK